MKTKELGPGAIKRLHHFGIPVDEMRPSQYWIVCVDRESERPDTRELQHLRRYRDFLIEQCRGEDIRRRLSDMPLPFYKGCDALIFKKLGKNAWVYRRILWDRGYASDIHVPLRVALDFITVEIEHWKQWKRSHPLRCGIR